MKLSDYLEQGYSWDHKAGGYWSVYSKGTTQHIFHMQGMAEDTIIPYNGTMSEMPESLYKQFYDSDVEPETKKEEKSQLSDKYEHTPNSRFTNGWLSCLFLGISSFFIYQLYPDFGSMTAIVILGGLWLVSLCGLFFAIKG